MKAKKYIILISTILLNLTFIGFSINLNINIISREKRGADESIKYASREEYKKLLEQQKKYLENLKKHYIQYQQYLKKQTKYQIMNQYLQKNWLNEIKIDKEIKYENGNKLWWPFQYHYNKTKIVIHHTANDYKKFKNPEEIKKFLRGIYRYHAFSRGWGDLGYHYIIDPWGNIYEGRAGGKGVIGAHAKWNNSPSIGIALIGNFEIQKPTKKQLIALIRLILYLSKQYNIDPNKNLYWHKPSYKYPYIKDLLLPSIVGHKDIGYTACPGNNLYKLLPKIRQISKKLYNKYIKNKKEKQKTYTYHLTSAKNINKTKKINNNKSKQDKLTKIKSEFIKKYNIKLSKYKTKKIKYKISLPEAKKLLNQNIKVFLYQLSTKYNYYKIYCEKKCSIEINGKKINGIKYLTIKKDGNYIILNGKKTNKIKYIKLYSNKGKIIFKNYNRKSYAGIPWNSFKGNLIFKKDWYKTIDKKLKYDWIWINEINFKDYLLGIAESNDQEPLEKTKALAAISKIYALFYMKNIHPNIPTNASYNAIDDPRIFQKYVGAGFENTSKNWKKAVNETFDYLVLYKNSIPILPYFNSSAGFTFSAKEKFGRTDTPYLQSKLDFYKGKYFNGHGVGLSGKGASIMAKNGHNWKEILKYYYTGIDIIKIK